MMGLKKIYITIPAAFMLCINLSFTGQPEEYVIKGVLLEKISTFVEWPDEEKVKNNKDKFVVGIIGNHKFGKVLKELYSNHKIQNKELVVKYIYSNPEINECRAIFIPKLNNDELKEIIEFVRKKPILTISDSRGYAEKGIHINFYTVENNIRFEINESAVKESGILMNHLLLSLAKLVETTK